MITKEIKNRRSIRSYKADSVPEEYITEVIKAGQFAPTAKNNKAVEFVVVREQKTKEEIFAVCGQEFVKEAQVLIIPTSDTEKSVLPVQDLAVASENMFLQATALGLGSVWKNLSQEWSETVKKIIGIPERYKVINIIPLGFPQEPPAPHSDGDFDDKKIHREKW